MPTVLSVGPYRFFFYAGDGSESEHVHVEREANVAKFWLNPVRLASSGGFRPQELRRIQGLVEENQPQLLRRWNDFFYNQ